MSSKEQMNRKKSFFEATKPIEVGIRYTFYILLGVVINLVLGGVFLSIRADWKAKNISDL